jgi:hypothetical protein
MLELIKERVKYDAETGIFTWNIPNPKSCYLAGGIAGSYKSTGVSITIDNKNYQAHKLAVWLMLGLYPTREVLHLNGNKSDNRWCNISVTEPFPEGELTQENFKKFFNYDPITGIFTRLITTSSQAKVGSIAGAVTKAGYLMISLNKGVRVYNHRLAFLYMLGKLPDKHVDHINRNTGDNRWCNLREVNTSENQCNSKMRINNPTGVKGVTITSDGLRYHAQIKLHGKVTQQSFKSLEEASNWISEKRIELHGEFARYD